VKERVSLATCRRTAICHWRVDWQRPKQAIYHCLWITEALIICISAWYWWETTCWCLYIRRWWNTSNVNTWTTSDATQLSKMFVARTNDVQTSFLFLKVTIALLTMSRKWFSHHYWHSCWPLIDPFCFFYYTRQWIWREREAEAERKKSPSACTYLLKQSWKIAFSVGFLLVIQLNFFDNLFLCLEGRQVADQFYSSCCCSSVMNIHLGWVALILLIASLTHVIDIGFRWWEKCEIIARQACTKWTPLKTDCLLVFFRCSLIAEIHRVVFSWVRKHTYTSIRMHIAIERS
jgi:hypothetical protein